MRKEDEEIDAPQKYQDVLMKQLVHQDQRTYDGGEYGCLRYNDGDVWRQLLVGMDQR